MKDVKDALEGAKHYELFPIGTRELLWQLLDAFNDVNLSKPDTYDIYERIIFKLDRLMVKNPVGTVKMFKPKEK